MSDFDDLTRLRNAFDERMGRLKPKRPAYPALEGDGNGVVEVPGRPGWIHVRTGDVNLPSQAYNQKAPVINDLPVVVGFDDIHPNLFQVLDLRYVGYDQGGYLPYPSVPPHHASHEWGVDYGGYDVVYTHVRQMRNLRVTAIGAFVVQIASEVFYNPTSGTYTKIATQTVDLATLAATGAGKARYALVGLDASGVIFARGGNVVSYANLDLSNCPTPQDNEDPKAAVRLYTGQTAISDVYDINDLREPEWKNAAQLQGRAIATTAPSEANVLTWSAINQRWYPAPAPSGSGGSGSGYTTPLYRWIADGPLAAADEVGGLWILPQPFRAAAVWVYALATGSAGSTIADVDYSTDGVTWTTLFANQAGRPTLAYSQANHQASATPDTTVLPTGTLVRMNIESAATGARGLTVEIYGALGSALSRNRIPTMGVR